MKKVKKSVVIPLVFFIYITGMAIYFLPRNTEIGDMEKYLTMGGAYIVVVLLWYVLRKREKLKAEREEDMRNNNTTK